MSEPTRESWSRIEALLGAALERPDAERAAFLDSACADDPALRREVDSLLEAHARTGALDALAGDLAPLTAQLRPETDTSRLGQRVNQYRVVSQLGQGGMGVVYEAFDEQLGRTVALKFLPAHLLADAQAQKRFQAEAR